MKDLKDVSAPREVQAIRYCRDTYWVGTALGDEYTLWDFNRRFKTDSSRWEPRRGASLLLAAGMMEDRAFVVFAEAAEMARFIRQESAPVDQD